MSLTITSTITTVEGFEVSNAYARVAVIDQAKGTELEQMVEVYSTEQAFLDGKTQLSIEGLVNFSKAPYDRAAQGTDILDLAHDAMIAALALQNITATKNL